ncbi:MAG: response regulator transcription factor, partial [Desulfobacterales bacterium]
MIKVLLADDHSIVRAGLRRLIEESGDMAVIAEAAGGREALRSVEKEMPDVAVVDISMPGLDGLEVIKSAQCAASRAAGPGVDHARGMTVCGASDRGRGHGLYHQAIRSRTTGQRH